MDSPQLCLPNSSQHSYGAGPKTSGTISACNYHELGAHGSSEFAWQRTQQCSVLSLLEDTLLALKGLIPDPSLFQPHPSYSTYSFCPHTRLPSTVYAIALKAKISTANHLLMWRNQNTKPQSNAPGFPLHHSGLHSALLVIIFNQMSIKLNTCIATNPVKMLLP